VNASIAATAASSIKRLVLTAVPFAEGVVTPVNGRYDGCRMPSLRLRGGELAEERHALDLLVREVLQHHPLHAGALVCA